MIDHGSKKEFGIYETIALMGIFFACIVFALFLVDAQEKIQDIKEQKALQEQVDFERKYESAPIISMEKLVQDRSEYFVVDVREIEEWDQGHIREALHVRLGNIVQDEAAQQLIIEQSQGKKIVFFCHDGDRSFLALQSMQDEIYNEMFITRDAYKGMRSYGRLPQDFWEGILDEVLPEDFDAYETKRKRSTKDVEGDVWINVSLEDENIAPDDRKTIYAPLALMKESDVSALLQSLKYRSIGVLCDSKVSCFYAKIFSYRHQKNGGRFEGYVRLEKE